jgi:hypothetical protein
VKNIKLHEVGLTSIVIPVMVPKSKRIEAEAIQIIYETLLAFSLIHPKFMEGGSSQKFPKIFIVKNGYDRDPQS